MINNKNKINIYHILYIVVNILAVLSAVLYPVTRDDFYYLDKTMNPILESYQSYFGWNPRLGQFVGNIIERIPFLQPIYMLFLFNAFFSGIYLIIYRVYPNLGKKSSVKIMLFVIFVFIILINYFGETFYYISYSANYTFPIIFYLHVIFLLTEFFYYKNHSIIEKLPYIIIIILGIFTGGCNEFVAPVILPFSTLLLFFWVYKNKKIGKSEKKLILLNVMIFIGFLFLFFAPANSKRAELTGVSYLKYDIHFFIKSISEIIKNYYYYNFVLMVVFALSFSIYFLRKQYKSDLRPIIFTCIGFLIGLVVLFSPVISTRLLTFTNTLFIVSILIILKNNVEQILKNTILINIIVCFLVVYLSLGTYIIINAYQNYSGVTIEIENQSKKHGDVVLLQSFNYFDNGFGEVINRKFLLDSGENYIDNNLHQETSPEKKLKEKYKFRSIKTLK